VTKTDDSAPVKDLMIVDNEELVRHSVRRLLRDEGFALIHEASNGREALDLLKALAARDELPALIVTDCSMPDMDGIALTRAVRAEPALSAIPIIVCSGDDANAKPASELGVPFFYKGHDNPSALKLLARALTKTEESESDVPK
jgi:two-component system chemotaxis response regulator CheY